MSEVLLINPAKRRARRKKTTARKRKTTRRKATYKPRRTTTRRVVRAKTTRTAKGVSTMAKRRKSYRKNPTRARKTVRAAARRARSSIGGLNFKSALKDIPFGLIGMLGAKFLAKRMGGGAIEGDSSTWGAAEYLKGGIGAVASGFLANMIKPGSGQKVMNGGLMLMAYEMVQNELIAKSEWAKGQFGADDYSYQPGDVESDASGRAYMLGDDYQWRQLPEVESSAVMGRLEPVSHLGQLEPVSHLGTGAGEDVYARALLGS